MNSSSRGRVRTRFIRSLLHGSVRRAGQLGLGVLVCAGLLGAALPAHAADDKITIMSDWSPHGMHVGLFLAQQKGWFRDAGLNVEVLDGKGSGGTIQQVAAGKIDIGFAQLGAMAPAVSAGLPVTSIMCFVRAGDNGLLIPANAGYKTLQDLRGKKIIAPNGAGSSVFMDAFLKAGGMSRKDFTIINIDNNSMISAYTSGQAEGALSTVAFFLPLVATTRPSTAIYFNDVGLRVPGYGLVVQRATIEKHPDMLAKVVAVQRRTWEYIFGGKEDEAIDAMMQARAGLRLERNDMMGQLKLYMPLFDTPATKGHPIGWQSEQEWQLALKNMEDAGAIKPGWKVEDFFTNRFIAP